AGPFRPKESPLSVERLCDSPRTAASAIGRTRSMSVQKPFRPRFSPSAPGIFLAQLALAVASGAACDSSDEPAARENACLSHSAAAGTFDARLHVAGEDGAAIAGAKVELDDTTLTTGADGSVAVADLPGPAVAIVSAEGFLSEPVVLGWEDAAVERN